MHIFFAITLEKIKRFEEALEYYDSAIQKNPEKADYHNGKAIVLIMMKGLLNISMKYMR